MIRLRTLAWLCLALDGTSAQASIVLRTSASQLGANDQVAWSQLGDDGATVSSTFSATSAMGATVGGSFAGAGGGVACNYNDYMGGCASTWASDGFNGDDPAFGTATSLLARASDPYGTGSGPLSFTFASGVSGVGGYVLSDAAFQYWNGVTTGEAFTAQLSLYNGATLLGTVSATSSDGTPLYLGATDTTGANITRAVYSLASIGTEGLFMPPASVTLNYDMNGGHADPYFCTSVTEQDLRNIANAVRCPQKAGAWPRQISWSDYQSIKNLVSRDIQIQQNGGGIQHANTDPSDLAAIEIGTLDLAGSRVAAVGAAVPEPATWAMMIAGFGLIGATLRRRRPAPALA